MKPIHGFAICLLIAIVIVVSCGPTPEEYRAGQTDTVLQKTAVVKQMTANAKQMTAETISGSSCEAISKTSAHVFFRCLDREYGNACYVTGDNLFCLRVGK